MLYKYLLEERPDRVMICCLFSLFLIVGCEKRAPALNERQKSDNWVSVGTLESTDLVQEVNFMYLFVNRVKVAAYSEGCLTCQVMVPVEGVERVHAFFKTNSLPGPPFHLIEEESAQKKNPNVSLPK